MADELRHSVLSTIKSNHFFLQEMHRFQSEHSVGLNMFGRIATEEDGEQKGKIDLKYRGTLPLVEAVRLLSLKHGLMATSTLERIDLLHKAGVLSDTEGDLS